MRTSILITCLITICFLNSVYAQSPLPLKSDPPKSEFTLNTGPYSRTGALFLLKDSSIIVSSSLVKEHYNTGNYEIAELYIDDINLIAIKRRGGALHGVFLGAACGAVAGVLTNRIIEGPSPPYPYLGYVFLGSAGAVAGATTGAIIGAVKIKIPINGSMENYNLKKKKLGSYTVKYPGSPQY